MGALEVTAESRSLLETLLSPPQASAAPHAGTCLMDPETASQPCYTSPGWKELSFLFVFVFW